MLVCMRADSPVLHLQKIVTLNEDYEVVFLFRMDVQRVNSLQQAKRGRGHHRCWFWNDVIYVEVYGDGFRRFGSTIQGIVALLAVTNKNRIWMFSVVHWINFIDGWVINAKTRLSRCYEHLLLASTDATKLESGLACAWRNKSKTHNQRKQPAKNSSIDVSTFFLPFLKQ